MTDRWNVAKGQTPHDKAMSYKAQQPSNDLDLNSDFAKLYSDGLKILNSNRFTLVRNPLGGHCGHDAYIRTKPLPLRGITYPTWFKTLRLIDSPEDEALLVSSLVRSPTSYSELLEFWRPLTLPVSGQKSSKLLGYVERLQRIDENKRKQNEALPFELGIQISNFSESVAKAGGTPRAYIPPRDWFAPEVQQLTFADVFTLWPEAELRMLQLILGRGCTGRANSQLIGEAGVLEHTFRSVGIIVGEDAGLGKSTIFNMLSGTFAPSDASRRIIACSVRQAASGPSGRGASSALAPRRRATQRSSAMRRRVPPKASSSISCPRWILPERTASSSASGTEAAEVLPCLCTVTMTRSIDISRRLAVASMMRRLAWCGISQSRSDF